MPDRQFLFDQHADHIPGGKTGSITQDIEDVVQIGKYRADGHHENERLKETQYPGQTFSAAHHKQDPDRIQAHVADAQHKDQ